MPLNKVNQGKEYPGQLKECPGYSLYSVLCCFEYIFYMLGGHPLPSANAFTRSCISAAHWRSVFDLSNAV